MAKLILNGSTSGSVTLESPAVSGTTTLTLPTTTSTLAINGPAFSAYASSGTSLSAATFTKVTYDTEEFDTNNNFASSRFTPTVAGYYQINASIFWNSTSANERVAAIYKNGSVYKWGFDVQNIANILNGVNALVYLNGSTDYVEIYGYSSNSLTTGTASYTAYFQGVLVRSA